MIAHGTLTVTSGCSHLSQLLATSLHGMVEIRWEKVEAEGVWDIQWRSFKGICSLRLEMGQNLEAEIQGVAGTQQGEELHRKKARPVQEVFKGSGRESSTGARAPEPVIEESMVTGRDWVDLER